jgi:hypothetical protein
MKIYNKSELYLLKPIISKAKTLWENAAREIYLQEGDKGSCILSDGIEIYYQRDKRSKYPKKLMIICSREVAQCQGSLHYEVTRHVALDYLKLNGIECTYNFGNMD